MQDGKVETKNWVLRLFSVSWGILFLWAGLLLAERSSGHCLWIWLLPGICFALVGTILPQWMRLPYVFIERRLTPVGHLFSCLIMALAFFCIITPYAMILRLSGWDPLRLKSSRGFDSAWIRRAERAGSYGYKWLY